MGSYTSWRAAMSVFYYPENYLLPTLRERSSQSFKNGDPPDGFVEKLRVERSLTPSRARTLADEFLKSLREDDKSFLRRQLGKSDDKALYEALRITDELRSHELDGRRHVSAKLLSNYIDKGRLKPDTPPYLTEILYSV